MLIGLWLQAQFVTAVCTRTGEPWPWNPFLRNVCFSTRIHKNVFISPNKVNRIEVQEGEGFRLFVGVQAIGWPNYGRYVVLPIEISWSPLSDGFIVNDGEGSGMNSHFHVFHLQGSAVSEMWDFYSLATAAFRKSVGCPASTADPTVRGIGWSKDGRQVFAFAQATVDRSCGTQGKFRLA